MSIMNDQGPDGPDEEIDEERGPWRERYLDREDEDSDDNPDDDEIGTRDEDLTRAQWKPDGHLEAQYEERTELDEGEF